MKNSAKKKGAKKKAAAIKKAAKKNRLVSKKISKVSGRKRPSVRKKPLINYDERRCTHVDPDTGETKVVSYTAVDDFGTRINPMVVEGQIRGGVAQGIGQA